MSKLFMASVIMPNETDPKTCVQFTQFSLFDILISWFFFTSIKFEQNYLIKKLTLCAYSIIRLSLLNLIWLNLLDDLINVNQWFD